MGKNIRQLIKLNPYAAVVKRSHILDNKRDLVVKTANAKRDKRKVPLNPQLTAQRSDHVARVTQLSACGERRQRRELTRSGTATRRCSSTRKGTIRNSKSTRQRSPVTQSWRSVHSTTGYHGCGTRGRLSPRR